MYNIIEQHQNHSARGNESVIMMMLNETKSSPVLTTTSGGFKIDCAKECPCNVPVIPVPDQWLEVMVTGGFKVWHIIFIIIAFMVTIVVVYCCFHRCRIPRTKQEIEADLMRTNLTTKFRDYLQEFPNEPTTFLEALKKVQELEEKWTNEQDDSGAKKRMGWLKLRGKDRQADKGVAAVDTSGEPAGREGSATEPTSEPSQQTTTDKPDAANQDSTATTKTNPAADEKKREFVLRPLSKQSSADGKNKQSASSSQKEPVQKKPLSDLRSGKMAHAVLDKASAVAKERQPLKIEPTPEVAATVAKSHKTEGEKVDRQAAKQKVDAKSVGQTAAPENESTVGSATGTPAASIRPARARRKRDKPNLSRTKAAHVGSRGESIEANTNILTIPVASHRRQHHHQNHQHQTNADEQQPTRHTQPTETTSIKREARPGKAHTSRTRASKKDSTVIQINTDVGPS